MRVFRAQDEPEAINALVSTDLLAHAHIRKHEAFNTDIGSVAETVIVSSVRCVGLPKYRSPAKDAQERTENGPLTPSRTAQCGRQRLSYNHNLRRNKCR